MRGKGGKKEINNITISDTSRHFLVAYRQRGVKICPLVVIVVSSGGA